MTREEAIKNLQFVRNNLDATSKMAISFDMAIKALEQEPKTGHWIGDNQAFYIYAKCSECGSVHDAKSQYCPTCGCLMEYEEETE